MFQNIVLQFVVITFMEKYFSADVVCIEAFLQIENYSEFPFAHMQIFHRFASVE